MYSVAFEPIARRTVSKIQWLGGNHVSNVPESSRACQSGWLIFQIDSEYKLKALIQGSQSVLIR